MTPFADILEQLDTDAMACLQAVYLGHGGSLAELEAYARVGPLATSLLRLADLGLVALEDGCWMPTWLGRGVHNWRQQVLWADSTDDTDLPAPRPEENGDQVVPGCNVYRPLYSSPGYCWCGLFRSDHASEAPETAAKFLAHKQEEDRRYLLLTRSTGRPVLELHEQLDGDQLGRAPLGACPPFRRHLH